MKKLRLFIMLFIMLFSSIFLCGSSVVYAQGVNSYSDVFDDLRADENFKAEEFLKAVSDDVDDTTKENINKVINESENTSWALRYCETDYLFYYIGDTTNGEGGTYGVNVENATILRLKFKTNGVTYNLGVIDNMTSHDNIPDGLVNETKGALEKILELVEKVMMIVSFIILLVVLGYVFPFLNFILAMLKAVWKLITLPFKLIAKLFKRRKY